MVGAASTQGYGCWTYVLMCYKLQC